MSDANTTRQLVVFSLGEEEYALPITKVQEIIRYTPPRAVASNEPWIRGVISLRGKIVPVYDLAARLRVAAGEAENAKIVIVETAGDQAGIIVDEVDEVLTVDDAHLDEAPTMNVDLIEAIANIDDRLVVLLDLDGLFAAGLATAA